MAETLLEAGEHRLLVAALDIDHPVGIEPRLGERRREQVRPGDAPEHPARGARDNAGREQSRGRAVDGARPAARNLVQRAECQPPFREHGVHRLDPERQDTAARASACLDPGNAGAQRVKSGSRPLGRHEPPRLGAG